MKRCESLLLAAAAAMLAATPVAAYAQAQAPRSSVRIPVGKDRALRGVRAERAQAAPAAPCTTDTVRLPGRVDTVTVNHTVTDTVTVTATRVDTVERPMRLARSGGFYLGLAGGTSLPMPDFNDANLPGWRGEAQLGYDPAAGPIGIRVGAGYGQNSPQTYYAQLGKAEMMNADGDLKLRVVSLTPGGHNLQVYGVGGVSWVRFRDVLEHGPAGYSVGRNAPVASNPPADSSWYSGMGWNAGAGFAIGTGRTNFFVEGRYTRFKGVTANVSTAPIVVGLSWY